MTATHISPYSGSWYPGTSGELGQLLEERFEESRQRTGAHLFGGALGFVVPHAGPEYSGTTAAAVYRSIEQEPPDRVVVLAFPHQGGLRGVAVPEVASIATPLGEVKIGSDWNGAFPVMPEPRLCDHSFEIQLPFLQKVAPKVRVAPLYVGRMDAAERSAASERLAEAWRPGTVFLASSDFTHYGRGFGYLPFPADGEIAEHLEELDRECIDAAGSLDAGMFLETLEARRSNVCGTAPIALLLEVLRRLGGDGIYQYTLDYQTSGDRTGDYSHSVSYAALGYYPRHAFELQSADQEALLDAAHQTLQHLRSTGERRPSAACGSPAIDGHLGAFVSLHRGGELLGCLGNCQGKARLADEVPDLTLAAALDDPRFSQRAASVEGAIHIEVSVLTPMRRIRDIEEFCVGRQGATMRSGSRVGLLLPQVATERGWGAPEFWRALARKTGLGPRAWLDKKVRLDVFEAQVFGR
jgi:MEMO1 family protein